MPDGFPGQFNRTTPTHTHLATPTRQSYQTTSAPSPCRRAMYDADLGLTRKDINLIMSAADVNRDGAIEYSEFVPVAMGVLTERLAQDIVAQASWADAVSIAKCAFAP